ncbi:hypothetical protein [Lonepinella sp. MS14437]|uniref:hypothetical protein n=1 Tax=unclassified Lonepinella TaxID=2642006 RepID=UPI0036D82998
MATITFEIDLDNHEIITLKNVIKALGGKKLKVKEDPDVELINKKYSETDFREMVNQARQGKKTQVSQDEMTKLLLG